MLDLGGGADDDAVAEPRAGVHIGARADLHVAADEDGALDHRPWSDARAPTDGDAVAGQMKVGGQPDLDGLGGQGRQDLVERLTGIMDSLRQHLNARREYVLAELNKASSQPGPGETRKDQ